VCAAHLPSREHFHANYDGRASERVKAMELNSSFFLFFSLSLAPGDEEKEEEKRMRSDDEKMTI
jgi:hypothetical protein